MPRADPADMIALRVAKLIGNGMGGFDWTALPLVCGWIGVRDVEALMVRLEALRHYARSDERAKD